MKLIDALFADIAPRAAEKNIVTYGEYRITVLTDRLFRMEYGSASFTDEATQAVWFRDLPPVGFSVSREGEALHIVTAACTLCVRPSPQDCTVLLDGCERALDNAGNLLGTTRTLDMNRKGKVLVNGKRVHFSDPALLEAGVVSQTGVAVLDDSSTPLLGADGLTHPRGGRAGALCGGARPAANGPVRRPRKRQKFCDWAKKRKKTVDIPLRI